jgi:glucose/arabinose dehydrogenase
MSPRRAALLVLLAALTGCGGSSGPGPAPLPAAPSDLAYAEAPAWYRAGEVIVPNLPTWGGGAPTAWSASPPLPAGLDLDPATGAITGMPAAPQDPSAHTITAANGGGVAAVVLLVTVGDPLPAAFSFLAPGFNAEVVAAGLATPVKIALAPDGRVFFNELATGETRILRPDGTLQPTPFAHTDVLVGNHNGLLGLALHPDFDVNGEVYTMACVPAAGAQPDRIVVKRHTDTSVGADWIGVGETVIVDDLPIGTINNGGDLCFDLLGRLFVSVGDVDDPASAQTAGERSGRILRFTDTGGIPADNPLPAPDGAEWCRGLRNVFGIAIHPVRGELYGVDNGPASDDWLYYLNGGRNFGWGGVGAPGNGIEIDHWRDVIVPTALAWHTGAGWGPAYENDLFLASYDDQAIRRYRMSPAPDGVFLNADETVEFARFAPAGGIDHKPLDLVVAAAGVPGVPAGALYVSTFTGIYRIVPD